jgi:hypothetical protein
MEVAAILWARSSADQDPAKTLAQEGQVAEVLYVFDNLRPSVGLWVISSNTTAYM